MASSHIDDIFCNRASFYQLYVPNSFFKQKNDLAFDDNFQFMKSSSKQKSLKKEKSSINENMM